MITIEQSRAARGLLGWTQQDLADASGLSKTAINNFEKQNSDIKHDSLQAIRNAFETKGVVFIGDDGVRKLKDQAHMLMGAHALSLLTESITHTLNDTIDTSNSVLNIINLQERHWPYFNQIESHDIAVRAICDKDILHTNQNIQSPNTQYRYGPCTEPSVFIYNAHVAIELADGQTIALLESQATYESERKNFEKLWAHAKQISDQKNLSETG